MDDIGESTKELRAWLVTVPEGDPEGLIDALLDPGNPASRHTLVLRADMVFGTDHLRSALYHAKKAQTDGRNSSDSVPMETLLYASGERQLSSAIKKMSATNETREIVVASLAGDAPVERSFGGWRDMPDTQPDVSDERLLAFGISRRELDTLSDREPSELVLERVAAVDIIKK